ncbi:MAG: hypothetical protein H0W69_10140 [Gemmatimonadaceae bacterium]|nr:hypothetical protein [Gemmatimonadaceae bacterium]
MTEIFLRLLYFGVLTPVAMVMRLFGFDPLKQRESRSSSWEKLDGR